MIAIRPELLEHTDAAEMKTIKYILDTNGLRTSRVDYKAGAAAIGLTRNAFKYHMDNLIERKIILYEGIGFRLNGDYFMNLPDFPGKTE